MKKFLALLLLFVVSAVSTSELSAANIIYYLNGSQGEYNLSATINGRRVFIRTLYPDLGCLRIMNGGDWDNDGSQELLLEEYNMGSGGGVQYWWVKHTGGNNFKFIKGPYYGGSNSNVIRYKGRLTLETRSWTNNRVMGRFGIRGGKMVRY